MADLSSCASHGAGSDPDTISSSSAGEKILRASSENTALNPARTACICARTPVTRVVRTTAVTYSATLSRVTSRSAPPWHSSTSGKPGSTKVSDRSLTAQPSTVSSKSFAASSSPSAPPATMAARCSATACSLVSVSWSPGSTRRRSARPSCSSRPRSHTMKHRLSAMSRMRPSSIARAINMPNVRNKASAEASPVPGVRGSG
mmetsp:Transcript_37014/g.97002  ORF Transcript_37014/g.97002 Transcript_37014/m.97002 type:complete len:203 (-) Transcript_37014:3006-3614(-)